MVTADLKNTSYSICSECAAANQELQERQELGTLPLACPG